MCEACFEAAGDDIGESVTQEGVGDHSCIVFYDLQKNGDPEAAIFDRYYGFMVEKLRSLLFYVSTRNPLEGTGMRAGSLSTRSKSG